ncbi:MAG: hypothetical protein A2020_02810 [Lentisphaerae bacterium GWF2_45_14]|nr:MAG: hypothetical protein A2020_02810 [Lentisphaerae bacterium GWF2_45_14]
MDVDYIGPMKSAYERTKTILFSPFSLGSYLLLGFCVWLASLFEGGSYLIFVNIMNFFMTFSTACAAAAAGSSSCKPSLPLNGENASPSVMFIFIIIFLFVVILSIGLSFVLMWVKARFEFIFLYNVLNGKSEIVNPWKRFAAQGNSTFIWRFVVSLLAGVSMMILFAVSMAFFLPWIFECAETKAFATPGIAPLCGIILLIISFLSITILMALLSFFFKQFVIPIMYYNNLKVWEAFCGFMKIFRRGILHFIAFAAIYGMLFFLVSLAVMVFSYVTFKLGSILLMIPYVWALVLLPVLVFFRLYGVEFLNQFLQEESGSENSI